MTRAVALFALALVAVGGSSARAEEVEGNVLFVPVPSGETLAVDNPLGGVRVRGWDEPRLRVEAKKHAGSTAVLDRLKVRVDVDGGRVRIATGVILGGGQWKQVPLAGAGIELTVDAPRAMQLAASTFNGDVDASGFRGGARLASEHGEIRAADITGRVDTRSLEGRQSLEAIRGAVDASGIEGDLELASIDGPTLDATVHGGQITAREVRSKVVRLRSTVGAIVLVGGLEPGGRYDLDTLSGDIRLVLRPAPFHLRATTARRQLTSGFALVASAPVRDVPAASDREVTEADYRGGGALLELESAEGAVSVTPAPTPPRAR